jgi:type IV secretory pathway ATPase VirB11/archaellum biosynthesis ATPase
MTTLNGVGVGMGAGADPDDGLLGARRDGVPQLAHAGTDLDDDMPFSVYPFPAPELSIQGFDDTVDELATHIRTTRDASGVPANAAWEKGLPDLVRQTIDQLRVAGKLQRIAKHLSDPALMDQLRLWTRLRASLLWPLSPFLTMKGGGEVIGEEVTILRHDRILVSAGQDRAVFEGPPEWKGDDDVLAFLDKLADYGVEALSFTKPSVESSFAQYRLTLLRDPVLAGEESVGGTIRIPAGTRFRTLEELVGAGTLSSEAARFLRLCVDARCNIAVSGGTKTGKTTFLRVLCRYIAWWERVVTVEDVSELRLFENRGDGRPWVFFVIPLKTVSDPMAEEPRISMKTLVFRAKRLAPDRIIVGETRGNEAADMIDAMTSGHDGCMTTVHAGDPLGALEKFLWAVCERGNLNETIAERRIRAAFDIVVQLGNARGGGRVVQSIMAVGRTGEDVILFERTAHGALVCAQPVLSNLPPALEQRLSEFFPAGRIVE